jgi:hypothetical protein
VARRHPRVACDRVAHDVEHALVDAVPVLAGRRRHHHEVGLVRERQVVLDVDREAHLRRDGTGVGRHDAEVEVRDAVVRPVETEGLARDAELERRETLGDDAGDRLHEYLRC